MLVTDKMSYSRLCHIPPSVNPRLFCALGKRKDLVPSIPDTSFQDFKIDPRALRAQNSVHSMLKRDAKHLDQAPLRGTDKYRRVDDENNSMSTEQNPFSKTNYVSSSAMSTPPASDAADGAQAAAAPWGEWMTGWKTGLADEADGEAARIDRQKAAFGAETLAKLKDLNVLVVGCRGVGVEAAKNLILSNVGAVVMWDPEVSQAAAAQAQQARRHDAWRSRAPAAASVRLRAFPPPLQFEIR